MCNPKNQPVVKWNEPNHEMTFSPDCSTDLDPELFAV